MLRCGCLVRAGHAGGSKPPHHGRHQLCGVCGAVSGAVPVQPLCGLLPAGGRPSLRSETQPGGGHYLRRGHRAGVRVPVQPTALLHRRPEHLPPQRCLPAVHGAAAHRHGHRDHHDGPVLPETHDGTPYRHVRLCGPAAVGGSVSGVPGRHFPHQPVGGGIHDPAVRGGHQRPEPGAGRLRADQGADPPASGDRHCAEQLRGQAELRHRHRRGHQQPAGHCERLFSGRPHLCV